MCPGVGYVIGPSRGRVAMQSRDSVVRHRYRRLGDDDAHSNDGDPRFRIPPHLDPKTATPKKRQLALAFGLFLVGTVLLTVYALCNTHKITLPRNNELGTSTAILVLGVITFCPGAYVSFVLAAAWAEVDGFDYSMVP